MSSARQVPAGIRWEKSTTLYLTVAVGLLLIVSTLTVMLAPSIDPFSIDKSRKSSCEARTGESGGLNIARSMAPMVSTTGVGIPKERRAICNDSYRRTTICEMVGDIRIHGVSSTIHSLSASNATIRSWKVKPHPRKESEYTMAHVRELHITELQSSPLHCQINQTIPAIVFSTNGIIGNVFHSMADLLVPLFITSHPFSRDVQFIVTDFAPWFFSKFKPVFEKLTRYDIIDLNSDDRIRCFSHVIVGLKRSNTRELNIDPSSSDLTLKNFTRLLRSAFSLRRSHVANFTNGRSPLLMLIPRRWSRRLVNAEEIARLAQSVGFDVMVGDGVGSAEFASVVNACDALMGVHGAGLTNEMFLPEGAVVVQVIPFGNLLDWSRECFGEPATALGLRYVEYEIAVEESTLVDLYPRNDTVFVDQQEVARRGDWGEVYMHKQNVRLNATRFRSVLSEAIELLRK